ncbi:MAG: nucleotidyltransferase domain-containing protein [Omnitrophica WOR_2 bacterium]
MAPQDRIESFEPPFPDVLPQTYTLLASGGLVAHPMVTRIVLHGSRGLAGNYRPDSDIDLSLLVEDAVPSALSQERASQFQEVIETTLLEWSSPVELDLAVIFPIRPCGLRCFQVTAYQPDICPDGGLDCFGIYKIQKGFQGFVQNAGIQVSRMYPCITIWKKPERQ